LALAEPATGFRQRDPHEGEAATEATEARVLFDRTTLYVGVLARDREPAKVIARLLERDRIMEQGLDNAAKFTGDDVIALTLDPFHDHRNAFFFATNPNGAEFEALVTDEDPTLNMNWRTVWRVTQERAADGSAPQQPVWRLGGDLKWELQPGLVLDATARPDFAPSGPRRVSTSRASPRARRGRTTPRTPPSGGRRSSAATRSTSTGSTCRSGLTPGPAWAS